jgi:hypothetical protein
MSHNPIGLNRLETGKFYVWQAHQFNLVPGQHSTDSVEYRSDKGQECNRLSSILRPVKDNLGLRKPGLYKIPCECGRVCNGQTGWSMDARLKDHQCHIWLEHPDKSAIAEHSINHGHCILFHDASILDTSARCMDLIVRKSVEVVLHPFNMNKEDGFCVGRLWKYFICSLKLLGRKPDPPSCAIPRLFPPPLVVWSFNVPPSKPLHIILCHRGNLPYW